MDKENSMSYEKYFNEIYCAFIKRTIWYLKEKINKLRAYYDCIHLLIFSNWQTKDILKFKKIHYDTHNVDIVHC